MASPARRWPTGRADRRVPGSPRPGPAAGLRLSWPDLRALDPVGVAESSVRVPEAGSRLLVCLPRVGDLMNRLIVPRPAARRWIERRELHRPEVLSAVLGDAALGGCLPKPTLQLGGPVFKHGKPIVL
jgi:hypothetical protein